MGLELDVGPDDRQRDGRLRPDLLGLAVRRQRDLPTSSLGGRIGFFQHHDQLQSVAGRTRARVASIADHPPSIGESILLAQHSNERGESFGVDGVDGERAPIVLFGGPGIGPFLLGRTIDIHLRQLLPGHVFGLGLDHRLFVQEARVVVFAEPSSVPRLVERRRASAQRNRNGQSQLPHRTDA